MAIRTSAEFKNDATLVGKHTDFQLEDNATVIGHFTTDQRETTVANNKLQAIGRITELVEHTKGRRVAPEELEHQSYGRTNIPKYNTNKVVDGVTLLRYDRDTNRVTIRCDHTECPSFWLEILLPLDQLDQFVKQEMGSDSDDSTVEF